MSYENAKSTKLLAAACCACGRPLRDAESVELGIGPICRQRHGHNIPVSDAARIEANTLIHGIAARSRMTVQERDRLLALGFKSLVARLSMRLLVREPAKPTIVVNAVRWHGVERLAVAAPYAVQALPAWRALGSWDRASKRWMVHRRDAGNLHRMLAQKYPSHAVIGLDLAQDASAAPDPATAVDDDIDQRRPEPGAPWQRRCSRGHASMSIDQGHPSDLSC